MSGFDQPNPAAVPNEDENVTIIDEASSLPRSNSSICAYNISSCDSSKSIQHPTKPCDEGVKSDFFVGSKNESVNNANRVIRKVMVIDPKKLQRAGLDRKLAEAIGRQKLNELAQEQKKNTKTSASLITKKQPDVNANSKVDTKTINVKTTKPKPITTQTIATKTNATNTKLPVIENLQHVNNVHLKTTLQNVKQTPAGTTIPSIAPSKFHHKPLMEPKIEDDEEFVKISKEISFNQPSPTKTPRDIARVLHFDLDNQNETNDSNNLETTSNLSCEIARLFARRSAVVKPADTSQTIPASLHTISKAPASLNIIPKFPESLNIIPKATIKCQKLPVQSTKKKEIVQKERSPKTNPTIKKIAIANFKTNTSQNIRVQDKEPKKHIIENAFQKNSIAYSTAKQEILPFSPLKQPFPVVTHSQDLPLPTISTFKSPFPTSSIGIVSQANSKTELPKYAEPNSAPKSLIVLENKVLKPDEKIDLTGLSLATPKVDCTTWINTRKSSSVTQPADIIFKVPECNAITSSSNLNSYYTSPDESKLNDRNILSVNKVKLSNEQISAIVKAMNTNNKSSPKEFIAIRNQTTLTYPMNQPAKTYLLKFNASVSPKISSNTLVVPSTAISNKLPTKPKVHNDSSLQKSTKYTKSKTEISLESQSQYNTEVKFKNPLPYVAQKPPSEEHQEHNKSLAEVIVSGDDQDPSFSAVDFIASLSAKQPITQDTKMELSPEELNLNASFSMNFSPLHIPTRDRTESIKSEISEQEFSDAYEPKESKLFEKKLASNDVQIGNIITISEENILKTVTASKPTQTLVGEKECITNKATNTFNLTKTAEYPEITEHKILKNIQTGLTNQINKPQINPVNMENLELRFGQTVGAIPNADKEHLKMSIKVEKNIDNKLNEQTLSMPELNKCANGKVPIKSILAEQKGIVSADSSIKVSSLQTENVVTIPYNIWSSLVAQETEQPSTSAKYVQKLNTENKTTKKAIETETDCNILEVNTDENADDRRNLQVCAEDTSCAAGKRISQLKRGKNNLLKRKTSNGVQEMNKESIKTFEDVQANVMKEISLITKTDNEGVDEFEHKTDKVGNKTNLRLVKTPQDETSDVFVQQKELLQNSSLSLITAGETIRDFPIDTTVAPSRKQPFTTNELKRQAVNCYDLLHPPKKTKEDAPASEIESNLSSNKAVKQNILDSATHLASLETDLNAPQHPFKKKKVRENIDKTQIKGIKKEEAQLTDRQPESARESTKNPIVADRLGSKLDLERSENNNSENTISILNAVINSENSKAVENKTVTKDCDSANVKAIKEVQVKSIEGNTFKADISDEFILINEDNKKSKKDFFGFDNRSPSLKNIETNLQQLITITNSAEKTKSRDENFSTAERESPHTEKNQYLTRENPINQQSVPLKKRWEVTGKLGDDIEISDYLTPDCDDEEDYCNNTETETKETHAAESISGPVTTASKKRNRQASKNSKDVQEQINKTLFITKVSSPTDAEMLQYDESENVTVSTPKRIKSNQYPIAKPEELPKNHSDTTITLAKYKLSCQEPKTGSSQRDKLKNGCFESSIESTDTINISQLIESTNINIENEIMSIQDLNESESRIDKQTSVSQHFGKKVEAEETTHKNQFVEEKPTKKRGRRRVQPIITIDDKADNKDINLQGNENLTTTMTEVIVKEEFVSTSTELIVPSLTDIERSLERSIVPNKKTREISLEENFLTSTPISKPLEESNKKESNTPNPTAALKKDENTPTPVVSKKRGRKPKALNADTSIASINDSTINANSSVVVAGTSEVSSNLNQTTIASETSAKIPKKRGRKPKALTADTSVSSINDSINNPQSSVNVTNASELSLNLNQTANDTETPIKVPKKRGRKPKVVTATPEPNTAENSTINEYNDTRPQFNERLLLITNRAQLETDEVLTVEPKASTSTANSIQCGLCLKEMERETWLDHLATHYGVGWILGETTAINVKIRNEVLKAMIAFLKVTQGSYSLTCRMCNRSYRSGLGTLMHIEMCGAIDNRQRCDYCNVEYSKFTIQPHMRQCKKRLANQSEADSENANLLKEEIFNNVGRRKRVSVQRAEKILKALVSDTSNTHTLSTKDVKHYIKLMRTDDPAKFNKKWEMDLASLGNTHCPAQSCNFESQELEAIQTHFKNCEFKETASKSYYICKLCVNSSTIYDRKTLARMHVLKEHKNVEITADFEADDSDCGIKTSDEVSKDDEVSSSVYSSEESSGGSDYEKSDIDRSSKKRRKGTVTANASTSEKFFPPRDPNYGRTAMRLWQEFTSEQYSNAPLFNDIEVNYNICARCDYENYLPQWESSMKFKLDSKLNVNQLVKNKIFGKGQTDIEWSQLKRFETIASKNERLVFIGEATKILQWVPLPADIKEQYLLIVTRREYTRTKNTKVGNSLLWLYKVIEGGIETPFNMQLHYAINIPDGPVHCLAFLPSGGYDENSNRLGLVAIGTPSSTIKVYALPLDVGGKESNDPVPESSENILHNLKTINLTPVWLLTLDLSKNDSSSHTLVDTQCKAICWSEFSGHTLIFAGYSNGSISLWDVTNEMNINRFIINDVPNYVPINFFYTGDKNIKAMAIHYDDEGVRLLAVALSRRVLIIYDLHYLDQPLVLKQDVAKNEIMDLEWSPLWHSLAIGVSDAFPNNGQSLYAVSPINIEFKGERIDKMNGTVTRVHYNPTQHILANTVDNGDLVLLNIREMHLSSIMRDSSGCRAVAIMDLKCLNGEDLPRFDPKLASADWSYFDKNHRENYGLVFGPLQKMDKRHKKLYLDPQRRPPIHLIPCTRINSLCCNINPDGKQLLAIGYENGFMRIFHIDRNSYFNYF